MNETTNQHDLEALLGKTGGHSKNYIKYFLIILSANM